MSEALARPVCDIDIVEHVWIEMSDGIRLSAKLWLPKHSSTQPVPGILEFIPYRKREATAIRDHRNHAWFAAHDYVCVRPDMRGHGDSEGIMLDEYSPREQQDAVEVIEWMARQSWCTGSVGMMGLSWGGIASLQAATHQPAALKAIIPVGASVDRYYDDGGYLFGAYPGQGLGWGGVMFGYCIRPPDPEVVGESWREMWMQRLEQTPMFAEKWLTHQLRDETWIQGSVCEHYADIQIPVLGVSGWNDCWPNTMIRLLQNISAPCRVVSGAWGHVYPNLGGPGPGMDFLSLALDWWDHWLKGIDNKVMNAPAFLAFIQDSHAPDSNANDRPGRWVAEAVWPSSNIKSRQYGLSDGCLLNGPGSGATTIKSPLTTGLATGEYMPIAGVAELPGDQRYDDARSACFDTEALTEALEILGTPVFHVNVQSDKARGLIAARLCDVAPDGASTLISYGIVNLKLRNGRERLAPVTAGGSMDVVIRFNDTGWRLLPGHRLRLAISTQLWPMAWPMPEQVELTLNLSASRLEIPARQSKADADSKLVLGEATAAEPPPHRLIRAAKGTRHILHDVHSNETSYELESDGGAIHFEEIGLDYGSFNRQRYLITEGDPLSARAEYCADFTFARSNWHVRTESELVVTCDEWNFFLQGKITAFENRLQVCTREWDVKIPRTVY